MSAQEAEPILARIANVGAASVKNNKSNASMNESNKNIDNNVIDMASHLQENSNINKIDIENDNIMSIIDNIDANFAIINEENAILANDRSDEIDLTVSDNSSHNGSEIGANNAVSMVLDNDEMKENSSSNINENIGNNNNDNSRNERELSVFASVRNAAATAITTDLDEDDNKVHTQAQPEVADPTPSIRADIAQMRLEIDNIQTKMQQINEIIAIKQEINVMEVEANMQRGKAEKQRQKEIERIEKQVYAKYGISYLLDQEMGQFHCLKCRNVNDDSRNSCKYCASWRGCMYRCFTSLCSYGFDSLHAFLLFVFGIACVYTNHTQKQRFQCQKLVIL